MSSVVKQLSFITALSQFPLDGWRFLALVFCVIINYIFFVFNIHLIKKITLEKCVIREAGLNEVNSRAFC